MIELKNLIDTRVLRKMLLSLKRWSIINVMGNVFSQIMLFFKNLRKEIKMICLNLKDKPAPEKREVFDSSRVRRNTWCGPYVAAAVCKIDYETAYQTFRKITGKRHVAGTHADEVKMVCSEHGVKSGEITRLKTRAALTMDSGYGRFGIRKKLHHLLRENLEGNLYIVCVTNHWVVVDGRDKTATDTWHAGEWVPISEFKHKDRQVKYYWPITSRPRF